MNSHDYTYAMARQLTIYVPELYRFEPNLSVIPVEHVAYVIGFLLSHDVLELSDLEALVFSKK